MVNRGPASLEVLRFVKGLANRAITVLGNHDLHLLCVAEGSARTREDDTLEGILGASDRDELLAWLRSRPLLHVDGANVLVHAGLLPQWSVPQARALAAEVESALRGPAYREFLGRLYGSEPSAWDETLAGADRLRVIVNAMTRLRFCTENGVMEFRSKASPDGAPRGYQAWFDVQGRRSSDSTVICGHWSALGLHLRPRLVSLDSGCVWGRALSAVRLEDRRLFQTGCRCYQAASAD